MIDIVSSQGTLVKKLLTSNDFILYFSGIVSFLIRLIKSGALVTVLSDCPKVDSNLARYFAVS